MALVYRAASTRGHQLIRKHILFKFNYLYSNLFVQRKMKTLLLLPEETKLSVHIQGFIHYILCFSNTKVRHQKLMKTDTNKISVEGARLCRRRGKLPHFCRYRYLLAILTTQVLGNIYKCQCEFSRLFLQTSHFFHSV